MASQLMLLKSVGQIKFSHDDAVRHGFDEASGGIDSCFTSSWNANAKLSEAEVVDKFGRGDGVRAFGR